MDKRVLITGAAGFIGAKMMELFTARGFTAFGWDRINTENIESIDMLDEASVIAVLERIKPNIVVHCAGSADVGKSVQYPETDYAGNVTITHNLLFALHKLNMKSIRVVFLSSAGVYGNPISLPITEDMPVNPLSPYALHKVMCEDMCRYFNRNYNMDIKVARIFSAYGAGLRKQIFWDMHMKAEKTGKLEMFGTGNESSYHAQWAVPPDAKRFPAALHQKRPSAHQNRGYHQSQNGFLSRFLRSQTVKDS